MSYRETDLPGLFVDFGVPVTIGTVTGTCLLDEADELISSEYGRAVRARGEVLDRTTGITVIAAAFPDLAIDQPLVIQDPDRGTRTGIVSDHKRIGDGALTHVDFSENFDEVGP